MISYSEVRRWKPDVLDDIDRELGQQAQRLQAVRDELSLAMTPLETPEHGESFGLLLASIGSQVERIMTVKGAVRDAAADITVLQRGITELDHHALAHGYSIGDNGAVVALAGALVNPLFSLDLATRVSDLRRQATKIDTTLAASLEDKPRTAGPAAVEVNEQRNLRGSRRFRQQVDTVLQEQAASAAGLARTLGTYGLPREFAVDWDDGDVSDSTEWHLTRGGFRYAVTGVIIVRPPLQPGGRERVEIDYQVHMTDRYNWADHDSMDVGQATISQKALADLHRAGLGKELELGETPVRNYKVYTGRYF